MPYLIYRNSDLSLVGSTGILPANVDWTAEDEITTNVIPHNGGSLSDYGYIEITEEQELGRRGKTIQFTKDANGVVNGFVYAPDPIDKVASDKINQLTANRDAELKTFQSDALNPGTMQTYIVDQRLDTEFNFVNSQYYDNSSIPVYIIEVGHEVNHSKDQFIKVYLDGRKWVRARIDKLDNLRQQVKSAQANNDTATINSITW